MSQANLKVAINIAVELGGRADLILKAIALSGYDVVARPGATDEHAKTPSRARGADVKWPRVCARCNKVINDEAAAEECTVQGCSM